MYVICGMDSAEGWQRNVKFGQNARVRLFSERLAHTVGYVGSSVVR